MRRLITVFLIFIANTICGQRVVNASFEGESPGNDVQAYPWSKCNNTINNSPDIFPGSWNVTLPASDGDTYLNLVVKEDSARESIFGIIDPPLLKGSCYKISMDIAVTDQFVFDYWDDIFDFTTPARLLVYLGPTQCDTSALIFDFDNLTNSTWETYSKICTITDTIGGIQLMTEFNNPTPYYGHVLIDNITIQNSGDTVETYSHVVEIGSPFDLSMTQSDNAIYNWTAQNSVCDTCSDNTVVIDEDQVVYGVKYDSSLCFSEYYEHKFITLPKIPNVFTPNNDGLNDLFQPLASKNLTFVSTIIRNRWGILIYESNQISKGWDGRTQAGVEAPEGTYFYVIEFKGEGDSDSNIYKGALTLLR